MAIIGTFEADFSQFTTAVRGAETSLRSLEGNAGQVATSVNRMSGQITSLAAAVGVSFSAAAIVGFGREVLRAADELQKLHDRTGLTLQALQKFQIAGGDAGNTVSELSAAIVQMQDRIAGGDRSAVRALERLGLSLDELRGLKPEDQFVAISDAIRQIEDPAQQVAIAIDLFGRAGANVLPTLKRGFDDLKDSTVGMSDETVAALDRLGDAFGNTLRVAKSFAGELLGFYVKPLQALGDLPSKLFGDLSDELKVVTAAALETGPAMEKVAPPELPEDLAEIEARLTDEATALRKVTDEAEKTAGAVQRMIDAQQRFIDLPALQPKDVSITPENFQPEGAYRQILDQATATREWDEAQKQMNADIEEGRTLIDATAQAHTAAGAAATASTDQAVQGYAAVASSLGGAVVQAERFIVSQARMLELGEAQRQFNQGRATTTQEDLLRGFEIITARGGGVGTGAGAVTVNMNVSGVMDARTQDELGRAVSQHLTTTLLQGRRVAAS